MSQVLSINKYYYPQEVQSLSSTQIHFLKRKKLQLWLTQVKSPHPNPVPQYFLLTKTQRNQKPSIKGKHKKSRFFDYAQCAYKIPLRAKLEVGVYYFVLERDG